MEEFDFVEEAMIRLTNEERDKLQAEGLISDNPPQNEDSPSDDREGDSGGSDSAESVSSSD